MPITPQATTNVLANLTRKLSVIEKATNTALREGRLDAVARLNYDRTAAIDTAVWLLTALTEEPANA